MRIKNAGLTISSEKSKFCAKQLTYVGYIIDSDGVRPNPEKVSAMSDFPAPTSVKEVQRLLGLVGWYRRFIPDFSSITTPISDLLRKNNKGKFAWTKEADRAFAIVKEILISDPIISFPDYT